MLQPAAPLMVAKQEPASAQIASSERFASIGAMVKSVFQVETAVVAILDEKSGACGPAFCASFCQETLSPESPTLLVVDDCQTDARYGPNNAPLSCTEQERNSPQAAGSCVCACRFTREAVVVGPPLVRFLCCAPLIGPCGQKYGVL